VPPLLFEWRRSYADLSKSTIGERDISEVPTYAAGIRRTRCVLAQAFFDKLSYSNKRRHVEPIADAKTPETRARRIEKSVAGFKAGKV